VSGPGRLLSVNVGRAQRIAWRHDSVTTAIRKAPVEGRVRVEGVHVGGDEQADARVHGGPDKAVYAYALEDYRWWDAELGTELPPGTFGENLTLSGIEVSAAVVGERWAAGSVLLEVAQPRLPCYKLGLRMGDQGFVRRFARAGRPGAYLRILEPGELGAGDAVRVVGRPGHGVTVAEVSRARLGERGLWAHVLRAPELPATVVDDLRERLRAEAVAPEAQSGS
jgi:MOSC domain-containing protein YiiM